MTTWKEMRKVHPELVERCVSDFTQHPNGGWYENTATVIDSILQDCALVKDYAKVYHSVLKDNSKVENYGHVSMSKMANNSIVSDTATVDLCELFDYSHVIGSANIKQCHLVNKALIVGVSKLTRCIINNARIDIKENAYGTTFETGTFTYIPLEINNIITGYPITIDWNGNATTGCQKHSFRRWLEVGAIVAEENNIEMNKDKVEELVGILSRLWEFINNY